VSVTKNPERDADIYRRRQSGERIKVIADDFGLEISRVSAIIIRERERLRRAAEDAARAAREQEAGRPPGAYATFIRLTPDATLRAEIEAARREAPFSLPFKGRID
jgi:hypothetical protein